MDKPFIRYKTVAYFPGVFKNHTVRGTRLMDLEKGGYW